VVRLHEEQAGVDEEATDHEGFQIGLFPGRSSTLRSHRLVFGFAEVPVVAARNRRPRPAPTSTEFGTTNCIVVGSFRLAVRTTRRRSWRTATTSNRKRILTRPAACYSLSWFRHSGSNGTENTFFVPNTSGKKAQLTTHMFQARGLSFMLTVGKAMNEGFKTLCSLVARIVGYWA